MPIAFNDTDPVQICLNRAVEAAAYLGRIDSAHDFSIHIGKQGQRICKGRIFKTGSYVGYVFFIDLPTQKVFFCTQVTLKLQNI